MSQIIPVMIRTPTGGSGCYDLELIAPGSSINPDTRTGSFSCLVLQPLTIFSASLLLMLRDMRTSHLRYIRYTANRDRWLQGYSSGVEIRKVCR